MNEVPATATPALPSRLTLRKKRALVRKYNRELTRGRDCYGEADRCADQLRAAMKPGEVIEAGGELFKLVDNFATSNAAFKTTSVKRFEIKRLNKTEAAQYRQSQQPAAVTIEAL